MNSKILLLICLMSLAGGAQASSAAVAVYEEANQKFLLHEEQKVPEHFRGLSDFISDKSEKSDKKIYFLSDKKEKEWEREKFCHPSAPVPVPASIVLFISGLLGITTLLYRKRLLSAKSHIH